LFYVAKLLNPLHITTICHTEMLLVAIIIEKKAVREGALFRVPGRIAE